MPAERGSTMLRCTRCGRISGCDDGWERRLTCPHCCEQAYFERGACPACRGLLKVKDDALKWSAAVVLVCTYCNAEVVASTGKDGLIGYSRGYYESLSGRFTQDAGSFVVDDQGRLAWRPTEVTINGRKVKRPFWYNDQVYRSIADEIDSLCQRQALNGKPPVGVTFDELKGHLGRLYRADELKPKWLRVWIERCIEERLIVCREGRYFRVFSMSNQGTEKDGG